MADPSRVMVFNERNQPVELHVDKQVIVIPARGHVELDETQMTAPQLQSMVSRGLLSLQPAPETIPDDLPFVEKQEFKKKKRTVKPKTGRGRRKPK